MSILFVLHAEQVLWYQARPRLRNQWRPGSSLQFLPPTFISGMTLPVTGEHERVWRWPHWNRLSWTFVASRTLAEFVCMLLTSFWNSYSSVFQAALKIWNNSSKYKESPDLQKFKLTSKFPVSKIRNDCETWHTNGSYLTMEWRTTTSSTCCSMKRRRVPRSSPCLWCGPLGKLKASRW